MKKKLLLVFTLAIYSFNVKGVDYHLFPDSNASWQIRFWIGPGYPYVYYYYYMDSTNNDTIINGNTYGKLYSVSQGPDTAYAGSLRETNSSQVYFCPKDSLNEYLLYDYSINNGDTVSVYVHQHGSWTGQPTIISLVVAYKDSVLLANRIQRYLQFTDGTYWIEGVGSTYGLLEYWAFSVSGITSLICMSHNDTTWMQGNYTLGSCSLILQNISEDLLDNIFTFYPNPAHNDITILSKTEYPSSSIGIFNITGQCVYSEAILPRELKLNCESFSDGIYFIKVSSKENHYFRKLIVQH